MIEEFVSRIDLLHAQLDDLSHNPDKAKELLPYSFRYLSDFKGSLKQLQGCLTRQPLDEAQCDLFAGGLGRLVLEYGDLPNTDLGKQLLWLVTDVVKWLESGVG